MFLLKKWRFKNNLKDTEKVVVERLEAIEQMIKTVTIK
jgi:hypothetical protein